ncbi:MAG: hypothetical protein GX285_09005, partial [Clostridiales bacterium]|nr:hypothetical protein [Clostridiales bacterium]
RPEFLNRIDEIVMFKPLTESEIIKIIEIALKNIEKRLAEKNMTLGLTDKAKKFIAKESYSPVYGARPVKRFLQKNLETAIATDIIKGKIKENSHVLVDEKDGKLIITNN